MKLVSIRIITENVGQLARFYEAVTGSTLTRYTEDFAELQTSSGTLAIGSTRTLCLFGAENALQAGQNRSAIIEFLVEDVDLMYEGLKDGAVEIFQSPTTMPWGNRSLLLRDPDGNMVNFFTPVTPEALKKFSQLM